ncbi:hypothetical protein AX15_006641 [Amanita polypyramis BW_CC]|nr:hypothetical protein AX15_006641 [Amanita polypyramis BW_CC]
MAHCSKGFAAKQLPSVRTPGTFALGLTNPLLANAPFVKNGAMPNRSVTHTKQSALSAPTSIQCWPTIMHAIFVMQQTETCNTAHTSAVPTAMAHMKPLAPTAHGSKHA